MKKIFLAAVLVLGSVGYVFMNRSATTQPSAIATETSSIATVPTESSSAPAAALPAGSIAAQPVASQPAKVPSTNSNSTSAPIARDAFKNGTYTGSVADAYYGNIQVAAVISGGKLSNVKILQYPNDRRDSIEINSQALPMLIQEAISAQSANVDTISGASDTSDAFRQSLAAALAQAKA